MGSLLVVIDACSVRQNLVLSFAPTLHDQKEAKKKIINLFTNVTQNFKLYKLLPISSL